MSNSTSKSIDADGYEAIESALLATDRGRLFLAEYARRRRADGTVTLLDAICRLEDVIRETRNPNRLREDLEETRRVIEDARREVAAVLGALEQRRDLGAERLVRVVQLLKDLDSRLAAMIALWDDEPPTSEPEAAESASGQEETSVERPAAEESAAGETTAEQEKPAEAASGEAASADDPDPQPSASAAASLLRKLQAMTPEERLALFR